MFSLILVASLPGQFVDNPDFTTAQQLIAFEATVRTYHHASRSVGTAVAVGKRDRVVYFLDRRPLGSRKSGAGAGKRRP